MVYCHMSHDTRHRWVINGQKMWITNGGKANWYALPPLPAVKNCYSLFPAVKNCCSLLPALKIVTFWARYFVMAKTDATKKQGEAFTGFIG